MYFVYLLKSEKTGKLYIGLTNNIDRRFMEHNEGKSPYTKQYRPWKLVYYEAFLRRADASKRELALKDFGRSYGQLKRRLTHSLEVD